MTIFIITSFSASKKAFNGRPLFPRRLSTTPQTMENTTSPSTFMPPLAMVPAGTVSEASCTRVLFGDVLLSHLASTCVYFVLFWLVTKTRLGLVTFILDLSKGCVVKNLCSSKNTLGEGYTHSRAVRVYAAYGVMFYSYPVSLRWTPQATSTRLIRFQKPPRFRFTETRSKRFTSTLAFSYRFRDRFLIDRALCKM